MKNKLQDYLNAYQREKLLFIIKLYDVLDDMIISFKQHNVLTKEEVKNLKTSFTYGTKAIKSIIDRLNPSSHKTLMSSMKDSNILLVNNFMRKKYLEQKSSDTQKGYELSKEYYNLAEITMDKCCLNCETKDIECSLYKHLEDNCIVDMEFNIGNCRFAYKK